MDLGEKLVRAAAMAGAMGWQMLWALVLGFTLSAVVQAVVSKKRLSSLLPDASAKSLAIASGLGAASSSCSYAAVALARTLVRKGANFTASMVFQIASTNFVIELGILLVVLMGWSFFGAELAGGVLMIALLAILFRALLSKKLIEAARKQAEQGLIGKMERHANMDMAVKEEGSLLHRAFSTEGQKAISHYFVMEILAVYREILVGLALSGIVAIFIPNAAWATLFFADHPLASKLVGPLVGPLVAMVSFVCSVGNVPLAAVLWNKGISFGGVIAFLFADLIVLPILNIYRKYYGWKMTAFIAGTFYVAMAGASLVVELVFSVLHLVPSDRSARVETVSISWNYTAFLNIGFGLFAVLLVIHFIRCGGPAMLRKREQNAPKRPRGGPSPVGFHV
jgi:uncharacterized membrane protein YraQ (UPF0718 family)